MAMKGRSSSRYAGEQGENGSVRNTWAVLISSHITVLRLNSAVSIGQHWDKNESFLNTLWERLASFPSCNCSHDGEEYFGARRLVFK